MAVGSHHEQIDALVQDAIEQQIGDGNVPGSDPLGVHPHPVPRKMPRDVRARQLAVLLVARVGVRGERHDVLRSLEQRKRVSHRPGGFPARIPGDQHPVPDARIRADAGNHEDRPSAREDDLLGKVPRRAVPGVFTAPLADDREVRMPAEERNRLHRIPVRGVPLVRHPRCIREPLELLPDAPTHLFGDLPLPLEQLVA